MLNLPFSISDIWVRWRSALSAIVPECQKLTMASIAAEHSKCNHMMTLAFKGLEDEIKLGDHQSFSNWSLHSPGRPQIVPGRLCTVSVAVIVEFFCDRNAASWSLRPRRQRDNRGLALMRRM